MSRFPSDDSLSAMELNKSGGSEALAPIQRDKFTHFFTFLLDHDRDGYISRKDFALLSEVESTFKNLIFNFEIYKSDMKNSPFFSIFLQEKDREFKLK